MVYRMVDRSPVILYGTETGTARDSGEALCETLRTCNLKPRLFSFDDFGFSQFQNEPIIIFIVATSGQGQMPSNSRKNWHNLLSKNLSNDHFSRMKFAVAALGDSSYVEYNFAGKKLFRRLLTLGATPLIEIALCDDQHEQGMDAGFEPFTKNLQEALLKEYPEMVPFDDLKYLPPKFTIRYLDELTDKQLYRMKDEMEKYEQRRPSETLGYRFLEVLENKKVTKDGHFQDTHLISLNNDFTGFSYKPGDIALIQPENVDEVVQMAIEALGLSEDDLERRFYLEANDQFTMIPPLHIISYPASLTECFKKLFDFNALPTRHFFKSLSKIAVHDMEKTRLEELSDYKNYDDYLDYVRFPRRSIAEVLRDFQFSARRIPIERYFDIFPFIRPRSFSICSSHMKNPSKIQVIVARVELKRKNMLKPKLGLCSNFLARSKRHDVVQLKIQDGTMNFELPDGWTKVCIATGTGIAPFRSLIAEHAYKNDLYPIILFFGCRGKELDNYFGEEWPKYENTVVFQAFSRDGERKVYVQHMMEQNSALIQRLIRSKRVTFYIAGSSGEMPKAIRATLKKIIEDGQIAQNADKMLSEMEIQRLIQFETWL